MKIAYSPCPNDTFVFHAWAHGLIPGAPELDVLYADIDITNKLAAEGSGPDVLKISYAALPWVLKDYALLPCGGALGRGCGPLVLTRTSGTAGTEGTTGTVPDPAMLSGRRVAVPSERSTACYCSASGRHRTFRAALAKSWSCRSTRSCPPCGTASSMPALSFMKRASLTRLYGLALLTDLGSWWESDTNLPIPLGAIIARRSMDLEALAGWARASVEYAWAHPEASRDYVLEHAQEMDPQVAEAHIDLYVNEFTADLGESGYGAVLTLLQRAAEEGLVPQMDYAALLK